MSSAWGSVARLGTTPFKGGAHQHPHRLEVDAHGPVGDRTFALVEEHRSRGTAVVRTVENPQVLRVVARTDADGALHLAVPGSPPARVPPPVGDAEAGEVLVADYWGRATQVVPVPGPWDAALSHLLGRDVRLVRTRRPGAVVYAEPVTVVTTSSLRELARRAGTGSVDDERFRATVLVDTGEAPPFCEEQAVGRVLRLGDLEVEVTSQVPRCAVVRLEPGTARRRDDDPLRLLAGDRTRDGEVVFGVGAVVRRPGPLVVGDPVRLA